MQFSWIIFGNLILLGNYYFLTSPNLLLKSFMQYSFIIFHLLCIYDATFKIPTVFWEFLITLLFLFKKSVRFMSFPISPFNWRLDLYLNLRESNIFLLLHFLLWSLLSKLPSFTSEAPALSPKFLQKAEEPEIKLPTSIGSWRKQENSRKKIYFFFIDKPKPLTVWITTNCSVNLAVLSPTFR